MVENGKVVEFGIFLKIYDFLKKLWKFRKKYVFTSFGIKKVWNLMCPYEYKHWNRNCLKTIKFPKFHVVKFSMHPVLLIDISNICFLYCVISYPPFFNCMYSIMYYTGINRGYIMGGFVYYFYPWLGIMHSPVISSTSERSERVAYIISQWMVIIVFFLAHSL